MAASRASRPAPLGAAEKLRLSLAIVASYLAVRGAVRTRPLPEAVERLARPGSTRAPEVDPVRLGRIAYRLLRFGPYRARCLTVALVAMRLLRRRGVRAELVIGLPEEAESQTAHAWVEIDGVDVGPPPGREGRVELVRYPR